MEFTELADYAIPAGTITEWIPSVGPHAATPALARRLLLVANMLPGARRRRRPQLGNI